MEANPEVAVGYQVWQFRRKTGHKVGDGKSKDSCDLCKQTVSPKDRLRSSRTSCLSPTISTSATWNLGPFGVELHPHLAGLGDAAGGGPEGGAEIQAQLRPGTSRWPFRTAMSSTHPVFYTDLQSMIFHMATLAQTDCERNSGKRSSGS